MASPTRWTWVWVNSGSWWWTGRPGVLRFMELQRIGHEWATELNWTDSYSICDVVYLLVVLICISLVTNAVNIFSCVYWPFCISSFKKCLFKSCAHFLIGNFSFKCWVVSDPYLDSTNPLSDVWLENIFFNSAYCLGILMIISFTVRKFSVWSSSFWFCLWSHSQKTLLKQTLLRLPPMFSSRNFVASDLICKSLTHLC